MKTTKQKSVNKSTTKRALSYLLFNPKELFAFFTILLIIIAPLTIWGVVAYKHHVQNIAIQKERAQYAQAEKDTKSLAEYIIDKSGAPEHDFSYGRCSGGDVREFFGKPDPFSCNVGNFLIYGANNLDDAQSRLRDVSKVVGEYPAIILSTKNSSKIMGLDALKNSNDLVQRSEDYTDISSSLACSVNYSYLNSTDTLDNYAGVASSSPETLVVDVGCGGTTRAAYYQLKN